MIDLRTCTVNFRATATGSLCLNLYITSPYTNVRFQLILLQVSSDDLVQAGEPTGDEMSKEQDHTAMEVEETVDLTAKPKELEPMESYFSTGDAGNSQVDH